MVEIGELWSGLQHHADLLRPVAKALDHRQSEYPAIGGVYASFLGVKIQFSSFSYSSDEAG